ncbi:hypothetical protein GALL_466420 [mine drainage metagenome]|uniref:Uncharacterized protein n=1 Tax=mine drainage metagenome TaxID=410659 RepID=A0A1J5Q2Q8_9ZZZZ
MAQRRQRRGDVGALGADLDAQRGLADRRQQLVDVDRRADALGQPQALEPGGGQHDAVVVAGVELAQPGVEIAAQRRDAQIGPQRADLHFTAQARGADHGSGRQLAPVRRARRHPGVARVLALHDQRQGEALGQVHRHVLQRVHREVGAAVLERLLEFLDEQPLAADFRQRAVENLVAARGHALEHDFAIRIQRAQQALHVFGLPQREAAFAGRDDQAPRIRRGRFSGILHGGQS